MTRWRWPLAGACAAVAAWPLQGTLAGALCGAIAAGVACLGYGRALERVERVRRSPALAATGGLAVMLILATALAQLGLLAGAIQRALVLAGVALAALPREAEPAPPGAGARFYWIFGGIASAALVAIALLRAEAPVADGASHVLAVKRLWDTGELQAIASSSGLHVVGEAVFAWGGGAELAGVFEAGLCASLLIFLVAGELARSSAASMKLAFALAVVAIAIEPPAPGWMIATLFHLAAIVALRESIEARRTAWHALAAAVGLAMIRHELVFLAAPYAVAAVALPRVERPSRRLIALVAAGWFVALCGVQIALGIPAAAALGKSVGLLAAVPVAAVLLRLVGTFRWRSDYGTMCFAIATFLLALATYAVQPPRHAVSATFAATFAAALAILSAAPSVSRPEPGAPHVRVGTASVVLALFVASALMLPNFRFADADEIARRFSFAVIALRERMVLGPDHAPEDVLAAQQHAPEGARIAFWGKSAARLDFARNPIRDVSFASPTFFLGPIAPRRLDGIDYVLLEDVRPGARFERRHEPVFEPALGAIAERLDLEAAVGAARLFRVRP